MAVLTCGELKKYNGEIPALEILVDGELVGYLKLRRGETFHITKTLDNDTRKKVTLASSSNEDHKFTEYFSVRANLPKFAMEEIMHAFALTTIIECTSNLDLRETYGDIRIDMSRLGEFSTFSKFIEDSIEQLKTMK